MKTSCKPQSILYPQPVLVIASYDKEGHADAMVAAWGGIYDTNQIGFMLDHRHQTTENIRAASAFTVSMATVATMAESDYFGCELLYTNNTSDVLNIATVAPISMETKVAKAIYAPGEKVVISGKVTVLLINIFAFAVAMLLTKKIKGTNIFRTVFFMPNLIGGIVLGYVWQLLLNGILAHFQKTLTYSSKYGFWGLVILMLWQQIGYMMIIYISGIQNIPGELIEAAEIDGANKVQLLRYVTIPMVMPSITICTFLTLTNGFKLFDQNLALTNGGPDKMSEMLALNIYNTFYGRTGWEGVGQAKAVIFFIIVGVIALIQNKMTTSKEVQQ